MVNFPTFSCSPVLIVPARFVSLTPKSLYSSFHLSLKITKSSGTFAFFVISVNFFICSGPSYILTKTLLTSEIYNSCNLFGDKTSPLVITSTFETLESFLTMYEISLCNMGSPYPQSEIVPLK